MTRFAHGIDRRRRRFPTRNLATPHADARLVEAVSQDLRGDDGSATATAVRMIWTRDHLDAARRLAGTLVGPAAAMPSERSRRCR